MVQMKCNESLIGGIRDGGKKTRSSKFCRTIQRIRPVIRFEKQLEMTDSVMTSEKVVVPWTEAGGTEGVG